MDPLSYFFSESKDAAITKAATKPLGNTKNDEISRRFDTVQISKKNRYITNSCTALHNEFVMSQGPRGCFSNKISKRNS